MLVIQNYVSDIIFGATNGSLSADYANSLKIEFGMSMMGELMFFFGLHITETSEGKFINLSRYTNDILKKCDMDSVKPCTTLLSSSIKIDKDDMN